MRIVNCVNYDSIITTALPDITDSIWTILDRNIFVQINLKRVFPLPNCTVMINDIKLSTIQQNSVHMQGIFFHGTFNITSRYPLEICEMNMTVVCEFGNSYTDVIATYVLQNCNGYMRISCCQINHGGINLVGNINSRKSRIQLARASEETLSSEQDLSTNSPNILPCIVMANESQSQTDDDAIWESEDDTNELLSEMDSPCCNYWDFSKPRLSDRYKNLPVNIQSNQITQKQQDDNVHSDNQVEDIAKNLTKKKSNQYINRP
ncbi:unnamed protein product [Mytilus coruscus]|uniref:Uncharacterized protein n=1 Tax=Mytilus coruscus TaxID=42192 RepID=A0A6J8CWL8_MYTCO|nr:unnamed protein product [Mytilus coruscus]